MVVLWVGRVAVARRSMKGALRIQFSSTVVAATLVELDTLLIILLELIQLDHRKLLLQRTGSLLFYSCSLLLLHVGVSALVILLL